MTEGGRKEREEKVCAGEHPQTTSRKYPASLFQRSIIVKSEPHSFELPLAPFL